MEIKPKTNVYEVLESIKTGGKNVLENIADKIDKEKIKQVSAKVTKNKHDIIRVVGANNITIGLNFIIDYFIEQNPQLGQIDFKNIYGDKFKDTNNNKPSK